MSAAQRQYALTSHPQGDTAAFIGEEEKATEEAEIYIPGDERNENEAKENSISSELAVAQPVTQEESTVLDNNRGVLPEAQEWDPAGMQEDGSTQRKRRRHTIHLRLVATEVLGITIVVVVVAIILLVVLLNKGNNGPADSDSSNSTTPAKETNSKAEYVLSLLPEDTSGKN